MSLPSPSTLLGLPGFDFWRTGQSEVFDKLLDWYYSPVRFLGLSCPTGSGKSLDAILLAKMTGARTCIITATKGLQEQLLHDFGSLAVVLKGQNNFTCTLVPTLRADEGPCHEGMPCAYSRSGNCAYRAQLQKALDAKIVITNYAYYLAQTHYSSGLGNWDLICLDEGHLAFSAMENFLTIFLSRMDVESQGLHFPTLPEIPVAVPKSKKKKADPAEEEVKVPTSADLWSIWVMWAAASLPTVESNVADLDQKVKGLRQNNEPVPSSLSRAYRTAKGILARLTSISDSTGDWVIQRTNHGFVFTPRWVKGYASRLFGAVPKVVLMSAILSQKTCDYLGVDSGDSRSWLEVGSYFPPGNTPIYHIPTARINYRTDDYGTTIWQSRVDQIIQRRLDRKGIIFTVSYERARLLLSRSRFKDIMLTHSTSDVSYVVNKFKAMKAPAVLVSPSVTTGWDFPAEQYNIRYLIAGKLPYPDTQNPVNKSRHEDDKDWSSYVAMDTLVQELGRATRSVTDRVECLIIDDSWIWYYHKYKDFAPKWFRDRVRGSLSSVPDPLV